MQKKKLYICVVCLLLIISVTGYLTFAYLTKESSTTNVITTGNVQMELYEEIKADGVEWEVITTEEIISTSIMPGDIVEQIAYIKNTGSEDFYARVLVEVSVEMANGEALDAETVNEVIEIKFDENWIEDEDGWYRYTEIVKSGESSEDPVFTEVYFSAEMDNSYIGSTITIVVGSQSVQAEYNGYDTTIGETVQDIDGFPEIQGSEGTE